VEQILVWYYGGWKSQSARAARRAWDKLVSKRQSRGCKASTRVRSVTTQRFPSVPRLIDLQMTPHKRLIKDSLTLPEERRIVDPRAPLTPRYLTWTTGEYRMCMGADWGIYKHWDGVTNLSFLRTCEMAANTSPLHPGDARGQVAGRDLWSPGRRRQAFGHMDLCLWKDWTRLGPCQR
jgi:hypothetical protein